MPLQYLPRPTALNNYAAMGGRGGDRGGSGDRVSTKVSALNPERIRVNDTGIS